MDEISWKSNISALTLFFLIKPCKWITINFVILIMDETLDEFCIESRHAGIKLPLWKNLPSMDVKIFVTNTNRNEYLNHNKQMSSHI